MLRTPEVDLAEALDPVVFSRNAGIDPDPWQAAMLRSTSKRILLNVSRQSGKALHVDTPILTPKGWTTMGIIRPGDHVFDERGHKQNVINAFDTMHDRPCYRVLFSDDSTIVADADHEWVLTHKGRKSIVVTTTQLMKYPDWCVPSNRHHPEPRAVTRVVPIPSVPVRCIEVTGPSHLYLAGRGLIPTHNSTTAATLAVWTAVHCAPALILLVSRAQRQSGELFRKCLMTYNGADRPVDVEHESVLQLELENGSRIISLPGKEETIRSYSAVDLLLIDEASRVDDNLYRSVRPMLAVSQGKIVVMSTPHGKRGFFWEVWNDQDQAERTGREQKWERYRVTADQCPRISAEFLAEEKEALGDWYYQQEYMTEFLEAESSFFRQADIEETISDDIELWPNLGFGDTWSNPVEGEDDPIAWDLSA